MTLRPRRVGASRRSREAAGDAALMSANILSAPAGAELDGAVLFSGRKRT